MSRPTQRATPETASRPPGAPGVREATADEVEEVDEEESPAAPWHFKVLLLGTAGYLVYRLIWLIFWLTGHGWHG